MKRKYLENIKSGSFYHISNHAVSHDLLFCDDKDYELFLNLLTKLVLAYAILLAYSLLPDHYHLILKINKDLNGDSAAIISNAFRKLGSQYARAINKKYNRRGTLFMRPYKRTIIENENSLRQLIVYLHLNPVKHSETLVLDYKSYEWSSYKTLIFNTNKILDYQQIFKLFDTKPNLIEIHESIWKGSIFPINDEFEFRNCILTANLETLPP